MAFSGHTSLSFAGNSYIKYRLSENSKEEDFRLALRLRTLQSNGIVMYTRANPCIILKVIKMGYLFLQSVFMLIFWLSDWGLKPFLSFKFRRLETGLRAKTSGHISFYTFRFRMGSLDTGTSLSRVGSRAALLGAVIMQQFVRMHFLMNSTAGVVL